MKLTPCSRAFAMMRRVVASSVGPPKFMVPRQSGETFTPLRPRLRYSIGYSVRFGSKVAGPCPRRYVYAPFCARACVQHGLRGIAGTLHRMARLVMKFGGTSLADIDRIRNVARHVKREVDAGHEVAVVVSAMAGTTNQLVAWAREAAPLHDAREYDAVVASGEQVTAGLLAIVLEGMGVNARSWQGWQLPILTTDAHGSARIEDINGTELIKRFRERRQVAVIAGFQGVHKESSRVTTLGRGGSGNSAVAIAAPLPADRG